MAKAKFIPILTQATGLCNTRDPARLQYDLKTGTSQLAQAVNVDIDQTGRIRRCRGYAQKRSDAAHSAWSDGSTCLYVSGTNLYRLTPDYDRVVVRSGLTAGAAMRFEPVGDRIYYLNGYEKGFVRNDSSYPWEKGADTTPDNNVAYSDPPDGHLLTFAFGRMLVATDTAVFASEPAFYGRFNRAKYRREAERITMLRGVPGGLFVGTRSKVLFYGGDSYEKAQRVVKADYGVLEGSETWAQPEQLGIEQDSKVVLFATTHGICLGTTGGGFRNLTDDDLKLPSALNASAAIADRRYIVSIQP